MIKFFLKKILIIFFVWTLCQSKSGNLTSFGIILFLKLIKDGLYKANNPLKVKLSINVNGLALNKDAKDFWKKNQNLGAEGSYAYTKSEFQLTKLHIKAKKWFDDT
jgi:hypothetical protein